MKKLVAFALTLCSLVSTSVLATPMLVSSTWDDNSIHILDESFNSVTSFTTGGSNPNGVAANNSLIFSGHFLSKEVIAYDHAGVEQYRWSSQLLSGLQGMTVVGNELAIYSQNNINFFDMANGSFLRSFNTASSIEGIAFDGTNIWALGNSLFAYNPTTGALMDTINNAAAGLSFGGTGIASLGQGQLALAGTNGTWYTVSTTDGSVINSGNNGLNMYGLSSLVTDIPEPSTLAIFALGILALTARRVKKS